MRRDTDDVGAHKVKRRLPQNSRCIQDVALRPDAVYLQVVYGELCGSLFLHYNLKNANINESIRLE